MVTLGRFPAKGCMYCNLLIVTDVLVTFIELWATMSNWNRLRLPVIFRLSRGTRSWSVDCEIQIILISLKFADPLSTEPCLLLRRFFFSHRGERQTRVTGDEAQGIMGRRKKRSPFSPSHLPLRVPLPDRYGNEADKEAVIGRQVWLRPRKTKTVKIEPRKTIGPVQRKVAQDRPDVNPYLIEAFYYNKVIQYEDMEMC